MEDEEIARRRNNEPLDLGRDYHYIDLNSLSVNRERYTVDQLIAALQVTTTLTTISIQFGYYQPTPKHNRRVIEPLCRCIANLRRHNRNHTLYTIKLFLTKPNTFHHVEQFLVAAKQFGIHHLELCQSYLRIPSLEEFCRDNSNLKVLDISCTTLYGPDSTIYVSSQDVPKNSTAALALNKLTVNHVDFVELSVATLFSNFTTRLTYPALCLGDISIGHCEEDDNEEKKIECMRVWSGLIKPSVQQLVLMNSCPIQVMDAIEACSAVMQIQLDDTMPLAFRPAAVQQRLQAIATRNHELARFVANPRLYPGDELLALLHKFDKIPTGRYMLARCFPEIPSFFKTNETNDSSTAGAKKRKRRAKKRKKIVDTICKSMG